MVKILCSIATYKRYDSTLPLVLQAVALQTRKPDKVIIFDDNPEPIDIRENHVYVSILNLLMQRGIEWQVIYAPQRGQHHIHQLANGIEEFDWVWRVDDDCVPEANVLENLAKHIDWDVGAIGGDILTPGLSFDTSKSTGKIDDIYDEPNLQWSQIKEKKEVMHLHCSFLYRSGVHDYHLALSRVAHREETLFTFGLYQKGYKVLIIPNATSWHYKNPKGGIRDNQSAECFMKDEQIFRNVLKYKDKTIIVLDAGMGDHVVFSHVLPDIKNPEVFSCYPELVPGRSIAEAKALFGDELGQYNIYGKMSRWKWKDSLEKAYRKLYVDNRPVR